MTRGRKVLIAAAAVVLVLAGAVVYVATNLDWIVKRAIEHYGSGATKTAVRVGSVSTGLTRGEGAVKGLTVANPRGFSSSPIFTLGLVSMKIEPRSVTKDPVVIDSIRIVGTRVLYETDSSGRSNVDALKKNLGSSERPEKKTGSGQEKEKRLRIRRLVIEDSSIEVRAPQPGAKPRTLALRKVELTDIGGPEGATPEQAAKAVITAIANEAGKEAAKAGAQRLLKKELERALRR
jgi:hypothetical protein